MHALQANLRPKFSQAVTARLNQGVPARYQVASNEQGFSSMVDKLNSESNIYSKIPLDQIETKMVKVKTVDAHGQVKEEMKEMAVCPECWETNCPCIARVTVQNRLDEENAKGVRNAKKPNPLAILPHAFNQMSQNLNQSASSSYFR